MKKEIDVNDIIALPQITVEKKVDDYFIILAPEYPNWIVLDDVERCLYKEIEKGNTVINSMERILEQDSSLEESFVINKMTGLLTKIYETNFLLDADISEEIPIEDIKKSVHINLTNNCNMRCSHCYMSAGMNPEVKLDYKKIISKMEEINATIGTTEVIISGGEPLMYPEVLELLKKLSHNSITLFTNGSLISEKNYEIICDNCKEIQISFEGLREDTYEHVRGKGNFSKVRHAIELIKRKNTRLILAITMLPDNVRDIQDNLVNFIKELCYDNIEIRLNSEIELSGNALSMDFNRYNRKEAETVIISLMKELNDLGFSIEYNAGRNTHFHNCGIGANLVVNYDGNIYPCSKFTDIKKTMSDPISEVIGTFNSLNDKTSSRHIKKCQKCELRYICAGGCRIDNYLANGSMTVPVCDEEYKDNQYRRLLAEYLRG